MSFGSPYGEIYSDSTGRHRRSMNGERYVYYKRLETDFDGKYKPLYDKAISVLNYRTNDEGGNVKKIAQYFFTLRDSELEKERKFLATKFGKSVSSFYDAEDGDMLGAELIKAFNVTLNLKEVFERNLALIKETNGQKQIITFFHFYFEKQWEENARNIAKEIEANVEDGKNFIQIAEPVLNRWVPRLVRNALIYMFAEAETESGITNGEKYQRAYEELLVPLRNIHNSMGNAFIQSFSEAYGLDELASNILKQLKESKEEKKHLKDFKLSKHMNIHSKGGLASENLENFVTNFMLNKLQVQGISTQTGSSEIKADTIITFDLPDGLVEEWLQSTTLKNRVSRERNLAAILELQKKLNEFTEGFIVYTNAKNYTLNSDFAGRGGFSAGEAMSLQKWDTMMHIISKKGRDLIFSAMQLIPGAIGEGRDEQVSNMFARAIASALFDDFNTIDLPKEQAKVNIDSIHLLYLNGIYFPLSFYYDLLARAFDEYSAAAVSDIVKVSFKMPTVILFKEPKDQTAWMAKNPGQSAWREQQQVALDNINVSYHFLRAYKKIMGRLNLDIL